MTAKKYTDLEKAHMAYTRKKWNNEYVQVLLFLGETEESIMEMMNDELSMTHDEIVESMAEDERQLRRM